MFRNKQFARFGAVAFVIGFCLLAYELVAARLLAPYIGSSIYVWTSVIGVIILALSLGYAFGGWLADRRVRQADISFLLLFSAAGAVATLLGYGVILDAIIYSITDPRLQGLVASVVLFAPTSFMLGSISPYLARLSVRSIKTTGRVVAALGAINSIGGISGTLITGFILFGYFGSKEILVLLIALLVATSWAISSREYVLERSVITVALIGLAALGLAPRLSAALLADIDTPTARYVVSEVTGGEEPFRVLITGPGAWQSGAFADGSNRLVFWYTRAIADVVRQAPKRDNILILGGGALSMPRYFADTYPEAHITVIEIDPELRGIAKEHFFYKARPNIEIINQDARAFLNKNDKKYDVVIVDAFSDRTVPLSLTTKEYVHSLARATRPGSVVAVNIIASSTDACGELFAGINKSYKTAFNRSAYFGELKDNLATRQNIIAVYSKRPLGWLDQTATVQPKAAPRQAFSDNFSPTDRLNFECLQQD